MARVVVIGGGIAGIEGALGVRELAPEGTEVVVVTPAHELLHEALGEKPWSMGGVVRHPLDRVCELAGATLVEDAVAAVEPGEHRVRLHGGGTVEYDALLAAPGARHVMPLDHALLFGSALDDPAVDRALELVHGGQAECLAVIVPPGFGWSLPAYEVAMRAAAAGGDAVVVTPEERPAEAFGSAAGAVADALHAAGVEVVRGRAVDVERDCVVLVGDRRIAADEIIALPWIRGPRLEGLPADAGGFLPVGERQEVPGLDGVFAAGDATTFPVRQGGVAAQQAAVAASSIARRLGAGTGSEPLRPVLRGVLPTPDGPLWLEHDLASGHALASREPLWQPAGRVAGVRLPGLLERLEA